MSIHGTKVEKSKSVEYKVFPSAQLLLSLYKILGVYHTEEKVVKIENNE